MDIKERIENIKEYFYSMNVAAENNGIIYVLVQFPLKDGACSEVTEHNFGVKTPVMKILISIFFFC